MQLAKTARLQNCRTAKLKPMEYKIPKIPFLVIPILYLCTDFEFEELNVLTLLWA
jgi:hypothetical protein